MAEIELTDVVDALSRLQLNYTSLAEQFYNIFFNPTPMNVTLVFIDERGDEVEVTIPNRAKDQKYIINGEGSPATNLISSDIGTIYQDILTGEVYVKYGEDADNWTMLISKNQLNSIIMQGQGEPNNITAPLGTLYVDTQSGRMYMQRSTTGNDGWERIDAYQTAKLTETFIIDHETKYITLSGICENKNVLNVYEDGIKLNPDSYEMPFGDNKTVVLTKPIKTPGEGETAEVVVEYYTDTHVVDSAAQQRVLDYVKEARFFAESIVPKSYDLTYVGTIYQKPDLPNVPEIMGFYNDDAEEFIPLVYDVTEDKYRDASYNWYSLIAGEEGDYFEDEQGHQYSKILQTFEKDDYFFCILEECLCIWNGEGWDYEHSAKYYRNEAQHIYESTNLDVTEAINAIRDAGTDARAEFQDLYDDVYNLTVTMREYIDENYEKFTAGVNKVDTYATQVNKDRTAVEIMTNTVRQLEQNTDKNAKYVELMARDFALKSEFQEFADKFSGIMERRASDFEQGVNSRITNFQTAIDNVDTRLTTGLEDEISDRTKAITKLQGTVDFNQSTCDNWFSSHSDLGDFSNDAGYFNRKNSPIDINGIYKYSKNIWKDLQDRGTNINLVAEKDCSYYAVDLGDYMESTTMADTAFDFTITPDDKSIDFSLPDKLDNDPYTSEYNDVVCVIRCFFKNESIYTPTIEWDYAKIKWLGAEPELDAKKSYIVEFISYDMMSSWEAHILGICQPAIDLDTFTSTFTINCSGMSSVESSNADVKMVAIIDGRELTLDDVYEYNRSTGKVVVPMEIERKFLGKTLSEIQLKSDNTPVFERYYADNTGDGGVPITLAQNQNYTITCKSSPKTVVYEYEIQVNSELIETYMRGGLSLEDYYKFFIQRDWENSLGYDPVVTVLPSEPSDGDVYVLTSDLTTYLTYYSDIQDWKSSPRIVPTSGFITSLNVQGKFTFSDGTILPSDIFSGTYNYDPQVQSTNNESGVIFKFTSAAGIMSDPLVSRITDTTVTGIKIRYNAMEAGTCYTAEDTLPVRINGRAYVNAEGDGTW